MLEVLASAIRQQKRKKRHSNHKGEAKLSLFPHDIILYLENPKDSTKIPLELLHEFSKVTEYKINVQKSVAFLYTNNEAAEREIKESIPFTIALKTTKYLGINLTKEVKNLYAENYRKLMKDIEEDTEKKEKHSMLMDWKNIVKTSILPKAIYIFNAILIKKHQHSSQS